MTTRRLEKWLLGLVLWAIVCALLSQTIRTGLLQDDYLHIGLPAPYFSGGSAIDPGTEAHPPLVNLLILPLLVLGWGKAWLMFLPLLCAIGAVAAGYYWLDLLGKRAHAAAFVLVFAGSASYWRLLGQFRTYTFLLFCFFAALWALEKFHQTQRRTFFRVAVALSTLLVATHFAAPLAAIMLVLYAKQREGWRWRDTKLFYVAAWMMGPGLACSFPVLAQKWMPRRPGAWAASRPGSYIEAHFFHPGQESLFDFIVRSLRAGTGLWVQQDYAIAVVAAVAVVLVGIYWRRKMENESLAAFLPFALIVPISWLAGLAAIYPFGHTRHCFHLLAAGSVCLTIPFRWLRDEWQGPTTNALLVAALVLFVSRISGAPHWITFGLGAAAIALSRWQSEYVLAMLLAGLGVSLTSPDSVPALWLSGGITQERREAELVDRRLRAELTTRNTRVIAEPGLHPLFYYGPMAHRVLFGRVPPFPAVPAKDLIALGLEPKLGRDLPSWLSTIDHCRRASQRCVLISWRRRNVHVQAEILKSISPMAGVKIEPFSDWLVVTVEPPAHARN